MKPNKLAVIDLGSNTFHLLIISFSPDGTWTTLAKDRRYVKLASDGLGYIRDESLGRALRVMSDFAAQIKALEVDQTLAIGTAALREAANGPDVAAFIGAQTGIRVDIIDGHQEALYIYKGITTCLPRLDRPCLIMDIGGGSVEFILYQGKDILFKASYRIGVAVLYRAYHRSDPISDMEINALLTFLDDELRMLLEVLRRTGTYDLIGASGSFEVIQDVLPKITVDQHWAELDIHTLPGYLDDVIAMDVHARTKRPEIPVERIDYIVVAYLLIRYLVSQAPPARLYYCDFALKEGVLAEMIEKERFRDTT